MILLNPQLFKQINITRDLKTSKISISNIDIENKYERDIINSKLSKSLYEDMYEKRIPTKNIEEKYDIINSKLSKSPYEDKYEKRIPTKNIEEKYEYEKRNPTRNFEEKYEFEKRNPTKNIEEKYVNPKEEKESTIISKEEKFGFNFSQENNLKSYSKEKSSYNIIEDLNLKNENEILNESFNHKKNEVLDKTNTYFNNIASK